MRISSWKKRSCGSSSLLLPASSQAYSEAEDALGLLDEAEQSIFDISEQRMKKSFVSMNVCRS